MLSIKQQNSVNFNANTNLSSKYYYFSYIINLICFIVIIFLLFKLYYKKSNENSNNEQEKTIKEIDIINTIVNKLISDIDKLKLLFSNFDININIIITDNDKIFIKNNGNDYYEFIYNDNKCEFNITQNNPEWIEQQIADKYIINKDYDNNNFNKDKTTKSLLSLHNNIINFIHFENKNNIDNYYLNIILKYIFKNYSICKDSIIEILSKNILELIFNCYVAKSNNKCIHELLCQINKKYNKKDNILHKIYKLMILISYLKNKNNIQS